MSNIDIFIWEFLGTTVLCLLGNGSVAAVVLKNSYSHGGGGDWLIIVLGWGFGVFAGASIAAPSGGHINPAVTFAVALSGGVPWSSVPVYWAAQLLGGFVGASLAWAAFKLQFDNNGRQLGDARDLLHHTVDPQQAVEHGRPRSSRRSSWSSSFCSTHCPTSR